MTKNAYRIEGDFQMGRRRQAFRLEYAADSKEMAREHVLAELGSKHGVPRRLVTIASIDEVPADQLKSDIVRRRTQ